jgi:hypothetical protein
MKKIFLLLLLNLSFIIVAQEYCDSTWGNETDDWITNVTFNDINNTTGQESGFLSYGDYTYLSTDVAYYETHTISVSFFSSSQYTQCVAVWIDWNQDYDFDDAGETYQLDCGIDATFETDIHIPYNAVPGLTRLRVSEKWSGFPDPCNIFNSNYGETEDYTINVIDQIAYGNLMGEVTQLENGNPIANAVIMAGQYSATTDENGFYEIENMHIGFYHVNCGAIGFQTESQQNVEIVDSEIEIVDFELEPYIYLPPPENPNVEILAQDALFTWEVPIGIEAQLNENFEEFFFPVLWQNIDNDGDGNYWFLYNNNPHESFQSIASASWWDGESLTPDNWLISHAVEISENSELHYWVAANDESLCEEHYNLKLSTTNTELNSFTETLFSETMEDAEWHERIIGLSEYEGETIYLAWQHTDSSGMHVIKIDDILIYEPNESRPYLYGYNVYLDDLENDPVAYTEDLFHLFESSELEDNMEYTAGVSAVYDLGESNIITYDFLYSVNSNEEAVVEQKNKLFQNQPNPFNPSTTIRFTAENNEECSEIIIYNLKGRKVKKLQISNLKDGNFEAVWNGTNMNNQPVSSGLYFYQLKTNGFSQIKKMILLK